MSGYHGPVYALPRCAHGLTPWQFCSKCRAEREAAELAHRRAVNDAGQTIRDAIEARRPWFEGCAFCVHTGVHEVGCTFIETLREASFRFVLHRVTPR